VESGFIPKAKSHANAVGMWQIISKTGTRFGLTQNNWIDERCDPMKAAQAAADYLSFLYDTFGNWPLALAAYNAGEGAVRKYGQTIPPYPETLDYISRVMAIYRRRTTQPGTTADESAQGGRSVIIVQGDLPAEEVRW